MAAENLAKRAADLVEKAFNKDVKKAARAEWPKVSGKATTLGQANTAFAESLRTLRAIRDQQLAVVAEVFKDDGT